MDIINVLLVAIGGTATALLAVGFLSKTLVSHLINKEMENHKAQLSHENNIALEEMKAALIRTAKNEDRTIEYELVMKRYKGPLLHAVYDLQSRLYNIIVQGLVNVYYTNGNDSEKEYVVNNTVFVIAQYFAWTEIIRREIQFIDFRDLRQTRELSELRDNVYGLWQTDGFDDPFRIWAGEQRAIGELMIENLNDRSSCIGYATFLKKLEDNTEPLFKKLQKDVESLAIAGTDSYPRLQAVQNALIDILDYLDPEYIRFPKDRRSYATVRLI
ncbi:MAG: hypothetical protein MI976_01490 [Pseudomonadales bacterium]|nr:hypothetical protein [Pseudomonadales bacterium]